MKKIFIVFFVVVIFGCQSKNNNNNSSKKNESQENDLKVEIDSKKQINPKKFCNTKMSINNLELKACGESNKEYKFSDSYIYEGIGMQLAKVFKVKDNYESTTTGHDYSYYFVESKKDSINFGKKGISYALSLSILNEKDLGFSIKSRKILFKLEGYGVIRVNDTFGETIKKFNNEDYLIKNIKDSKNYKEIWLFFNNSYLILSFKNDYLENLTLTNPGSTL